MYDLGSGINIYKTSTLEGFEDLREDLAFNCELLVHQLKKDTYKIQWYPITWRKGLAPSNLKILRAGRSAINALGPSDFVTKRTTLEPKLLYTK